MQKQKKEKKKEGKFLITPGPSFEFEREEKIVEIAFIDFECKIS